MWRTRVGYAGGAAEHPTYRAMADHTECFQVDFDPSVVTYEDLLELFWQSHDPTREPWKVQYASLVLAHDADQLAAARESAERVSGFLGRRVATRIEELTTFWPAEDYHQKYYLRNERVLATEFKAVFGDDEDAFRESTAAMRANSLVAGYGTKDQLEGIVGQLGLSERGVRHLRDAVATASSRASCRL